MTQLSLIDDAGFDLIQRTGKLLASSNMVPKEYQGNLPNCVIALSVAKRLELDPLMVMQNLHVVHGKPGWSAQFLISAFNSCGRFTSIRYRFEGEGEAMTCRAVTTEKATGEEILGSEVSIDLARREGWLNRNGSKWLTMPEQMLRYRAATFLVRAYAPELTLGFQTQEEILDVPPAPEEKVVSGVDSLNAELQGGML